MAEKKSDTHKQGGSDAGLPSMAGLYRAPAVRKPTVKKVRSMAENFKLDLSDNELEDITECIGRMLGNHEVMYRLVQPTLPVKYPRTPGYRPTPEEDPYNAWYYKTDIHGAPEGKLAGKTVAIKDGICVAGVPMMNGTKMMEGYVPSYDATVVTWTLDAGGVIKGKAAVESFCFSGLSCTNDIGPIPNPHDHTRFAGGSSSGNAVLLAIGEVDLGIGADQGGSIRIPASWCGVVGMKPTFGLIPYTGTGPMEPTLDHMGPMARNVTDCALLLEVIAGYDNGWDARQPEFFPTLPEYSKELKSDLSGMKIGLLKEGFDVCEPKVVDVVKKAAEALRAKGAVVEEVSIPMHKSGKAIWAPSFLEGAYQTMVKRGGAGPSFKGFHDEFMMAHQSQAFKTRPNDMSLSMKLVCLSGQYLEEINNHQFYCRGSNLTIALTQAYDDKLKDYDVLIMPTLPYTAPKILPSDVRITEFVKEALGMAPNTAPFCSTGHPAITVNAGHLDGLPVGLMVVGKKWHDQDVLNVAFAQEQLMKG